MKFRPQNDCAKRVCNVYLQRASPIQPAPVESPRAGTQQG
jgi:hypothetical protein